MCVVGKRAVLDIPCRDEVVRTPQVVVMNDTAARKNSDFPVACPPLDHLERMMMKTLSASGFFLSGLCVFAAKPQQLSVSYITNVNKHLQ